MKAERTHKLLYLLVTSCKENLGQSSVQEWFVENLAEIFHTEGAALLLFHQDGAEHTIKVSPPSKATWTYLADFKWANHSLAESILQRKSVLINDVPAELTWLDTKTQIRIRSFLLQPLFYEDQLLGVIAIMNRIRGKFTLEDQNFLTDIANVFAKNLYQQNQLQQLKIDNATLEVNQWQLLRSRNILRALFDSIPMSMYIVDKKFHLIAVNMNRANRINTAPSELVGRRCYEALYHNTDICPDCKVIDSLYGGKNTTRSKRQWQEDDQPLEWEINTFPIYDDANLVTQAIVLEQDVTEKRRLEASLAQSEKLAAVGQLAAGLAHEINNPLTAIIANTQLLQRELQADADIMEMIDLIARAGQRAAQVVRNLLDMARKEEYIFEPVDLDQTLQKAFALVQHELVARSIQLSYEPAEGLPKILASKDHLQGVWVNLLTNAIDSFEEGDHREIHVASTLQNNEVRVIFMDNGKGIPSEKLNRIFEPFYTTKAPGRGTGLGLSLCHRIIKQHGGSIHVDSEVGVGTIFTVALPIDHPITSVDNQP
ncbi:MAG: ATP-binding protein [Anaerolineales bacterium]